MKKILITGGCGFIGSNLVEYFLNKNFKVVVLDKYNFTNNWGWLENNKNKNLEIKLGDVRDFDFVNKIKVRLTKYKLPHLLVVLEGNQPSHELP